MAHLCRNQPKPLSGIETCKFGCFHPCGLEAMKAGINLNPYQGLKQLFDFGSWQQHDAGINLNPYQGLKQQKVWRNGSLKPRRNQPKPLSGIETGRGKRD